MEEENLVNAEDVEREVSAEELSESTGVKEYIKSNPELAKAYNESGATDEDINNLIESNPELKDALNYLNNNNVKLTDEDIPEPEIDEEEEAEAAEADDLLSEEETVSDEEIDSTITDLQSEDEEEEEEIAEDVDSMF